MWDRKLERIIHGEEKDILNYTSYYIFSHVFRNKNCTYGLLRIFIYSNDNALTPLPFTSRLKVKKTTIVINDKAMYNILVLSEFDYCISLMANALKENFKSLQVVRNKDAKFRFDLLTYLLNRGLPSPDVAIPVYHLPFLYICHSLRLCLLLV